MRFYRLCLPVFIVCCTGAMCSAIEPKPLGEVWVLPKAFKRAQKIEYTYQNQGQEQVLHVLVDKNAKYASNSKIREKVREVAVHYSKNGVVKYPVRNGVILFDVTDKNDDVTVLITIDLGLFEKTILRGGFQYKGSSNHDRFLME